MTDAELIADFIARNGVTVCPPGFHADPERPEGSYHWRVGREKTIRIVRRRQRFAAAARKRAAATSPRV